MKNFLQQVLAVIVGFVLIGIAIIGFCLSALVVATVSGSEYNYSSDGNVLHLNLEGSLTDRGQENILSFLNEEHTQSLETLVQAVKKAKGDKHIKAIFITSGVFSADLASLQELRKVLIDFKKTGKKIYAYGDTYGQLAYYLSSVADVLMINPTGMIDWHGLSSQPFYYKDFFDKIGFSMQLIRVGKYKSAGEPYIQSQMSEANKEQLSSILNSLWGEVVKEVSDSRVIAPQALNELANQYIALSEAKDYLKMKLVDKVFYIDQAKDFLKKELHEDDLSLVNPADFVAQNNKNKREDKIAVLYATGAIIDKAVPGVMQDENVVAENIIPVIETLKEDDDVKAVVLRINSPGGSATASEKIWYALTQLKKKKPLVVSMGGMAASGGYYMACAGGKIFADPTTITGSIGIFAMVPDASKLITQKLGLRQEVVKTNASADFLSSIARPLNPMEVRAMQVYVDKGYELFLKRVAEHRKKTTEEINVIAQGRIWSGLQAKEIGLVDELGGLEEAISYIAQEIKIDKYDVKTYPSPELWYEKILNEVSTNYLETQLKATLGVNYPSMAFMKSLKGKGCVQMLMPYQLNLD